VEFTRDIQPIFEASCVQCHARGKEKGGFSLETRADFLDGGENGIAAVLGRSAESPVMKLITSLDAETVMPKKGKKLTPQQVATFRAWIDQGMIWPQEITFAKHEPANLRPRELASLGAPAAANPVDGFVGTSLAHQGVAWPQRVDDRVYARRVWLDTIGLLPPTAELEAFVADGAADKRERLVTRLLENRQAYAEHWLTFWNDLLRNDYKGTGYIDGGRKPITSWLYTALARNLPLAPHRGDANTLVQFHFEHDLARPTFAYLDKHQRCSQQLQLVYLQMVQQPERHLYNLPNKSLYDGHQRQLCIHFDLWQWHLVNKRLSNQSHGRKQRCAQKLFQREVR
jgi:hypothetical protein